MFPFGKKEKEEVEVKDLVEKKPRVRRKKEPEKPWGKKERLIVLVIFVGTMVASGVLGLYSRGWKLPNMPRLDISLDGLASETVIIERDEGVQGRNENAAEELQEFTKKFTGVYGVYVYDVNEGTTRGVYQEETFVAASLIKLPVMATAFREADLGRIDLDDPYTIREADKISGSGNLFYKPAGTVVTYREMLNMMGQQSDNNAYGI